MKGFLLRTAMEGHGAWIPIPNSCVTCASQSQTAVLGAAYFYCWEETDLVAPNIDLKTVEGFGEEWQAFDQSGLDPDVLRFWFDAYFSLMPFSELRDAEGFDLGCGSGRWAQLVAPKVGKLHCIDPAPKALDVARRKLAALPNVEFHLADADAIPLKEASQDFGYSLGVLHHIPDTKAALARCVGKLKKGAPFLLYLYYDFDNRPPWFRLIWKASEAGRRIVSRLPFPLRRRVSDMIAAAIYLPLARSARMLERRGANVDSLPLSAYRHADFYTMRTDALDRFGTRLEQRFSRQEIGQIMAESGLKDIVFREDVPYWVALGRKA
jgi:ubiquinone/menaquinone biosynthesis C-methylase UbiE